MKPQVSLLSVLAIATTLGANPRTRVNAAGNAAGSSDQETSNMRCVPASGFFADGLISSADSAQADGEDELSDISA